MQNCIFQQAYMYIYNFKYFKILIYNFIPCPTHLKYAWNIQQEK
jgi:hypothetical protein